jgi:hypothetical protein
LIICWDDGGSDDEDDVGLCFFRFVESPKPLAIATVVVVVVAPERCKGDMGNTVEKALQVNLGVPKVVTTSITLHEKFTLHRIVEKL